MFIFRMELNFSTEGIWKQITQRHAAASLAFWLCVQQTVADVKTNNTKIKCLFSINAVTIKQEKHNTF